ncbi:MAG: DnaJ domain-containing protein [Geminicoccaceae bacterium]
MAAAGDPRAYYRALGVARTASADDIKAAFRERAKQLHPDRGGVGSEDRLQLVLEAYRTLRDPQLRLRYDAEGLASERSGSADPAADAPDPLAETFPQRASKPLEAISAVLTSHGTAVLGLALALSLAFAAVGWHRAGERGREIEALTRRVENAEAKPPSLPAADLGHAKRPRVYRSAFRFPDGAAEIDAPTDARLLAIADDLRRAIAALPAQSAWTVEVEGVIERAADAHGLLIDAWELALLRVGAATQYLVSHGIPAERVAVQFRAGAVSAPPPPVEVEAVAIGLVCCELTKDR